MMLAALALLLAEPPAADVVVRGEARTPAEAVTATIAPAASGQFGRFEAPFCPGVVDPPTGTGATLVRLLRANAVAAGARVGGLSCRPNAFFIFADDPAAFVASLQERRPALFPGFERAQLTALTGPGAPVRSWRGGETRGRDGDRITAMDEFADTVLGQAGAKGVRYAGTSRMQTNVREDIVFAFAVLDNHAAVGRTVRQLADLATMHLLVDLKSDAGGVNSILSLFAPRSADQPPPPALTSFDRGLLSGLYGPAHNNERRSVQRARIAHAIKQERKAD